MVSGSSDIQFQGQVSGGMDNVRLGCVTLEATFVVDDNDEAQRDPNDFLVRNTAIRESSISMFSRQC
ncbi:hypothetical protein OK016_19695 [Vibrio chagasii]|nr:hypothetical protein [Vibrio chagasii]